jgi:hypothetical protein
MPGSTFMFVAFTNVIPLWQAAIGNNRWINFFVSLDWKRHRSDTLPRQLLIATNRHFKQLHWVWEVWNRMTVTVCFDFFIIISAWRVIQSLFHSLEMTSKSILLSFISPDKPSSQVGRWESWRPRKNSLFLSRNSWNLWEGTICRIVSKMLANHDYEGKMPLRSGFRLTHPQLFLWSSVPLYFSDRV